MKTAAVQLHSTHNKSDNIKKAAHFVEEAASKGAKLIALPEVFTFRGMIRASKETKLSKAVLMEQIADEFAGPTLAGFQKLAKKHKIFLITGSVYERSPDPERAYNTSVLFDSEGRISGSYRKIHLFNADVGGKKYRESSYFLAGDEPTLVMAGDFSIGMSVCYDVRFPEMYREYSRLGADIFSIPSAFTQATGEAHWHTLVKARAVENLCYVLAPNQCGEDNLGRRCYGHSLIVDPWGMILAEASGDKEEIIYADISKDVVTDKRRMLGRK